MCILQKNPGGSSFSARLQTGTGFQPASCSLGTGSFQGVKSGRGVTLTPHPLLVPWSRKSRGIPLLPLWAVRPLQSACRRVHFTFTFYTKKYVLKSSHLIKPLRASSNVHRYIIDLCLSIADAL